MLSGWIDRSVRDGRSSFVAFVCCRSDHRSIRLGISFFRMLCNRKPGVCKTLFVAGVSLCMQAVRHRSVCLLPKRWFTHTTQHLICVCVFVGWCGAPPPGNGACVRGHGVFFFFSGAVSEPSSSFVCVCVCDAFFATKRVVQRVCQSIELYCLGGFRDALDCVALNSITPRKDDRRFSRLCCWCCCCHDERRRVLGSCRFRKRPCR